jgi:plasmid stabilization system protein ParE
MAKNNSIKKLRPKPVARKLTYSNRFYFDLLNTLEYGRERFGEKVSSDFYKEIIRQIERLPKMPDIHPKCRFVESTLTKTYRNILIRRYYIIYCIKASEIFIIDILPQAMNPETITKTIKGER